MSALPCRFPLLLGCPWGPGQGLEPPGGMAPSAYLPGWGRAHSGRLSCSDSLAAALPICESPALGGEQVPPHQTSLQGGEDQRFGLVSLRC